MQQRRCEEIAAHFIPKHHSKYLMRKNMLNTKFQWLAKYTAQDENQTYCLSKLVKVQQKQAFQLTAHSHCGKTGIKKTRTQSSTQQGEANMGQPQAVKTQPLQTETLQAKVGKSYLLSTFSSNLNRKSKIRVNTEPSQSLAEEKSRERNKSLMMRRSCQRKTPVFFEKENRKTFSEKLKSKDPPESRNRKNLQLEFFALTPWAKNDENTDNSDFVTFW